MDCQQYLCLPRCLSINQLQTMSLQITDIEINDQVILKFGSPFEPKTQEQYYSKELVRRVLLIKLNSLLQHPTANNGADFVQILKGSYKMTQINSQQQFYRQLAKQYTDLTSRQLDSKLIDTIAIGNSLPLGILYDTIKNAVNIIKTSEIAMAFSFQALNGRIDALRPSVHLDKNHQGQIKFAENILKLVTTSNQHGLQPSEMSHHRNKFHKRVQDSYSLRCAPQVHGYCYDVLHESIEKFEEELNNPQTSHIVIDNQQYPIFPNTERIIQAFDALILACHEISSISIVRSQRILNDHLNKLPFTISTKPEYSQFDHLYWQCTQLFLHNKSLTYPLSADSLNGRQYMVDISQSIQNMHKKMQELMKNILTIIGLEIVIATTCIRWDKEQQGEDGGKMLTQVMERELSKIGPDIPMSLNDLRNRALIFI